MHQSAQVATARNARNITLANVRQILNAERHTIHDEEIFGWGGYPHDLEFIDTDTYHETNDVSFRTIHVWANRFCVSDRVLFETNDGRLVDRDDINREERQFDHDYDIDWNDDWLFD